jgi:FkbM family methyltransferase
MKAGVGAATEHDKVPFEHDFRTVVDVGAHHGQFALVARERFPRARLICVEPQPDAVQILRSVPLDDVTVIQSAVSETRGRGELRVSGRDDSSSLLEIGPGQVEAFPDTAEVGRLSVETAPLDDLVDESAVERPALLKVDVQGAELGVLRSGEQLLGSVDELLVECSFRELYEGQSLASEVVAYLFERGFTLTGVFCLVSDGQGRCVQADWLFSSGADAPPERGE